MIEKYSSPPLAVELVSIAQSLSGKDASSEVSSNRMRRLFSLRMTVSKPKPCPKTQSKPTQRLSLI